jgi:ATP-binding cassette subfamily F protein 3
MEEEQATRDQLRRRRESMEKFVQRFGAKATKATQAQSRLKMIARIKDLEENLDFSSENSESNVFIHIPSPSKTPRILYELEGGAVGYAKPLATGISLSLERGQKVAIIGANGIGKSTLLRTIAGRLKPLAGRFDLTPGVEMSYFAQDQAEYLDMEASVLTNLLRGTGLGEPAARQLLGGFLFRGDDVFKKTKVLSGGELSRLGLACALGKKSGLILLDEPTNHLDMASVESLASGLDEFEGTVLFVSHDRTFIDAVCTHIFAMLPDGRSMIFPGKLADYGKLAAVSGFPNVLESNPETHQTPPSDATSAQQSSMGKRDSTHLESKERRSQLQKLRKKISQLEVEMTQIRDQIAQKEEEMANLSAHDFSRAAELHLNVQKLKNHLDQKEEDWLAASSEVETMYS